jgi:hypothetical protein
MRLLNFCILILLVLATAYVYEIKFEAMVHATRVAEMRGEVRREREAIAALRAEWARLENPARLQGLARRHLTLRPAELTQLDTLSQVPERPPQMAASSSADPIAGMIENADVEIPTGSIPAAAGER